MNRNFLVIATALANLAVVAATHARDAGLSRAPYLDPKRSIEARVADLLSRMTLEEKLAQLQAFFQSKREVLLDDQDNFDPTKDKARALFQHGLGQITRPSHHDDRKRNKGPRDAAVLANALQRHVIEHTRLGIPLILHEEGLHRLQAVGATHFPQPIALAATWDPALIERVFAVTAIEARSRGVHQILSPVLDVARDPRWGRVEETFGEDTYLVTRMGVAAVRGLQGPGAVVPAARGRTVVPAPFGEGRVIATAKHFAVHGQPESGMNVGPGNHSMRVVHEVFLPPFRAVVDAGVGSLMASYNEIDGIPAHANRWLLDDLLRKRWGWPGFVVSDYQGVRELRTLHGVAATDADAAFQALEAGVDIELPDRNLYKTLLEPFKRGELPLAPLDRAVARVLRAKFLLGLFENPYVDPDLAEQTSARPEHRELARVAAQRSIVLLKNAGNLLPLDRAKLKSLAVIGPNAERCALGGYSSVPTTCTGILAGIRAKVGAAIAVHHAEGCGITKENERRSRKVVPYTAAEDARLIADAVALAKRSDAAIVVVGDNEQTAREASGGGHFGDRGILDLFGRQDELVRAIVATGRPTVVVLINGRPPSINAIAETVPAILEGFYLGQEGGHAVADVLFGDANPGGKVPISFARSGAHAPVFYNHKPSARRGYFEEDGRPLFVFGHGLSYTTFARANLAVNPPRVGVGESVSVEVDVTNTGKVAGDEVVQVYVRDVVSSVTRPVKELKGFARVTLAPGETRRVALPIGPAELGFLDRDMKFVVEPGTFEIMVGGNSVNTDKATFEVVGAAAGALKDSRRRSAARRTGNTSDRSLR